MTLAELRDLYLEEAKGRVKGSTLTMDKSRIERHVKPLLGRHVVRSLTSEDVERTQIDIAAERPRASGQEAAAVRPPAAGGVQPARLECSAISSN